jgi:hypothetical protein
MRRPTAANPRECMRREQSTSAVRASTSLLLPRYLLHRALIRATTESHQFAPGPGREERGKGALRDERWGVSPDR